jgi:poly-gamma-glutamate synthesis protein (capsule biosynthesis protein)
MMRWWAYALLGTLSFVALHAAALMLYDPRDPQVARAEPVRISRAPALPGEATLLFAGDTAETDRALPVIEAHGVEYPFSLTVDLIRDADVAIVNHEAPITDGGREFPVYEGYTYRAPARSAAALAWAGFDLVTLANNHAMDYGAEGLADTAANAARAGLAVMGAGQSGAEARRGAIITIGELRVGVLAFCENQLAMRAYLNLFAVRQKPGVAPLTRADLEADIARLRPQVDVLVVCLHIGDNYQPPRARTIDWSRRAIDLGADLVVNHHPHYAHPVMLYRGRPILLSLGNYVWGTIGIPELDYGWLAVAHVAGRRLDRVEMIPVAVQNLRVEYRPAPLYDAELDRALGRMAAESARYGARLHIDRGRAILSL